MADDFKGKTVWITGASAGIGEALAHAFAAKSARLVLSARKETQLQQVAAACLQKGAEKIWVKPLDLAQAQAIETVASEVLAETGGIDILINNGGISQRALVKDTSMEVYRQLMEVNYFAAVALTQQVLPGMLQKGYGHVVAMSSLVGKIGTPLRSGYAASKHALHGFFDSLRAELPEQGFNVLLVCPGFIHTNVSVNALNAGGQSTGVMDKNQEQGMAPSVLADKVLAAMAAGKQEISVGGKEIVALYIKRFLPGLLAKIVRKQH